MAETIGSFDGLPHPASRVASWAARADALDAAIDAVLARSAALTTRAEGLLRLATDPSVPLTSVKSPLQPLGLG